MKKFIIILAIKYHCFCLKKTNRDLEKLLDKKIAYTSKRYLKLENLSLYHKAQLVLWCKTAKIKPLGV